MEPVPQKHEWQIRHLGVVSVPMTESQMRKRLMQLASGDVFVRQGECDWVRASAIIAKLEKLDRDGVYLRSRDNRGKHQTVGPFTPARAYDLLSSKNIENLEAKIGRESAWCPASQVMEHFEAVLAKAQSKQNVTKRPVTPEPVLEETKPPEVKLLQACPYCKANVNVARFSDGTLIACGSCSKQFSVGQQSVIPDEPAKPFSMDAADVNPLPLPDPVFESVQLPSPSQPNAAGNAKTNVNPYAAPNQTQPHSPHQGRPPSNAKYVIPGVFISLWGTFLLVMSLLRLAGLIFVFTKVGFDSLNSYQLGQAIGGLAIGIGLSIPMLIGGINMIRQRGISSARTGAAVAAIPCFGCFIFPLGIWACISLYSKQADADFR
ncbi:hypothetical protein LF1_49950 [Rubripirellula obstinata]|uniref:Uncharacterized protein n=1 Tax=Rubripirellula obstinata TaxID=406547 RepID=A0A5B1CQB6_9BACT|nr:hypothetical protein [Rubripirellula obstinata]KAA1262431.1 hypothetical protein LF1_49950 [Rubripirellula obstinata]